MENRGLEISVTLRGPTLSSVIEQAQKLIDAEGAMTTRTAKTPPKKGKTAAPPAEDTLELSDDTEETLDEETTDDTELGFDDAEVEAPAKSAKGKTEKITDKMINAAALAHAKANGSKAKTLAILKKKFDVDSLLELKQSDYPAVMKALKV